MAIDMRKVGNLDPLIGPAGKPMAPKTQTPNGASFRDTLADLESPKSKLPQIPSAQASALKFSNHAIERMRSRGVSFSPEQLSKLESAVKKSAEKGGKDSLILMNDTAVIVSVKNNTVVTVVDKASLKENVFTNIDSTIVV